MRVRLGVVADDLTGANAVGAQLAELGLPSIVTADPAALAAVPADRPAAVLDVDNRADPPDQAAAKVRAAVAGLTGSPYGGGVGVAAGADGVRAAGEFFSVKRLDGSHVGC